MADRVGQQLGNYQLIRLLGEGGFAEVYLAEHIHLGTQAAIKVLHTQLTSDDVDKFRTEARTIAHLIHPHIVRVLEFGVEGKTPFLVMDYAPNGTLRQRHPKGVALPFPLIVAYVKQVADALQYAHDAKLIHRDIKPENMLLGRRNELLLSDFGIALVAQSSRYQSAQEMAGTMAYIAPEQIQGKPRPASDQYSLGVVVYEWLSGDRPFHGSLTELVGQHLSVPPPSLGEKVPTLSPDVEQVVLTALEKDPHQRFGSIQAFATALEQANRARQLTALTPPTLPQLAPPPYTEQATPPTQLSEQRSHSEPHAAAPLQPLQPIPLLPSDQSIPITLPVKEIRPVATEGTAVALPQQSSSSAKEPTSADQSPQLTAAHTFPVSTPFASSQILSIVPKEGVESVSKSERVEKAAPVAKPEYGSATIDRRRSLSLTKKTLLVGTALLLIAASLGFYSIIKTNQTFSDHTHSTAQASTALANYAATSTSQADVHATTIAQLTATAVTQVNATATAIGANSYPTYLPGHGTLSLYDPLTRPYQWNVMSDSSFGGACQFTQGAYHLSETQKFHEYPCLAQPIFSNFALEVKLTIIKGDCGGMEFRYSTQGDYTFLVCANGSYSLDNGYGNGQKAHGSASTINIALGRSVTIAVYAMGGSFKLYVNGQYLDQGQYSPYYSQGSIGLFVTCFNNNPTEVAYNNAKVWTF
jgi:serine/threonine protein kinase